MEKYKELYNSAKEVFYEELSRSARIDEKASKYLTVLTFLLGAYAFFGREILNSSLPPENTVEWLLVISIGILLLLLVGAWFAIFSVFKSHTYAKIPIDIDFFDNNELIDIYYAFSKGLKANNEANRKKGDEKSKKLYHGYIFIRIIVILLLSLSLLFAAHSWTEKLSINQGGIAMTNDNNNQDSQAQEKPEPQKPNPNVQPPTFELVTESYDPSKIETRVPKGDTTNTKEK